MVAKGDLFNQIEFSEYGLKIMSTMSDIEEYLVEEWLEVDDLVSSLKKDPFVSKYANEEFFDEVSEGVNAFTCQSWFDLIDEIKYVTENFDVGRPGGSGTYLWAFLASENHDTVLEALTTILSIAASVRGKDL